MITSNFNSVINSENYTKTSTYNINTGAGETISVTFEEKKMTIKQTSSPLDKATVNLTEFQARTLMEILQKEFNYTPAITYRGPEFGREIENQPVQITCTNYNNDDTITL